MESNYAPELFYRFDFGRRFSVLRTLQAGLWHESNGLGGDQVDQSRAWNRVYLSSTLSFGNGVLTVVPRLWLPFLMDGNEDICDYLGYGEIVLESGFFRRFLETRFQLILRKGWHRDLQRGSVEFNTTVGPFLVDDNSSVLPLALFVQVWHGYGETLLQYNKRTTKVRVGVRFTLD